ncbi:uncharacterized protein LOC120646482 [Panicum virgatum]|uniref:uncharacterized protein LOC120646482 n=1 Tax=Panicum virgatum TaxID=38727 RepID=UPI0019D5D44B|nr:uncharacterized protein LOC120646482 [Panicum virgatum]
MKVEDHSDTNHRESQGGNGGGPLLLAEERRVGVGVAAVEAGVLLEPLVPEQLPGPAHHLLVAHRRRVRRQHGLHRAAERAARLSADGRLVVRRHVRGRLVRLAPAQQDAAVGARRRRVVVVAELGAGVGAEEREEVVGDVVGRVDARGAGEVADDGGVREEAGAGGARGGTVDGEVVGDDGGGPDLLLLLVDEAAAVARVGDHGEGGALRHPVHQLPEVHVRDEVEVAGHDGLVLARAMAAAVRDERAVAAVVEEEDVPGRGAGHHVGERALDVGAGREHGGGAAVVVGEHGDVAGREAEAGDEGVEHGEDVVDAASQLVGRAGVVAADQGSKQLLLPLHC